MKPQHVVQRLHDRGLLEAQQERLLRAFYAGRLITVHYELKLLLGLGSSLLATGIGLYVKEAITASGIVAGLLISILACFAYVQVRKRPFSLAEVPSPGLADDAILMLGCLLTLTLQGYLEYKYAIFAGQWKSLALAATTLFAYLAYHHDHKGVLMLAIAGLTSWVGITVNPDLALVADLDKTLVHTALIYAPLALGTAALVHRVGLKRHFTFVFVHFYANLLLSAALYGYLEFDFDPAYLAVLGLASLAFVVYGWTAHRVAVFLYAALYFYVAISARVLAWIDAEIGGDETTYVAFYLAASASLLGWSLHRARVAFRS